MNQQANTQQAEASSSRSGSIRQQIPHRIAAERAIARFQELDPSDPEGKAEAFIRLVVGRGFAVADGQP